MPTEKTLPLRAVVGVTVLVLTKLWLVAVQDLSAWTPAMYDDRLQVDLAAYLLAGDWLGPYGVRTLIKGPFYPMWVAAMYLLGIPLLLSEHLLYAVSVGLLTRVVQPLLGSRWVAWLLFGVLLFNPVSFGNRVMTRVVRNAIYPALSVLVIACAVAFLTRQGRSPWRLLPWSVGLGLSLGAFWLTREEGVWVLPAVVLLLSAAGRQAFRRLPHRGGGRLVLAAHFALPFALWGLCINAVAAENLERYGRWMTVELKTKEFLSAYGALARVGAVDFQRYVPVPEAARRKIYAVSPTFAELEPWLEGNVGKFWVKLGCREISVCDDLGAGWFLWALRDAAARAGYHGSARTAASFYRRIGEEVDAACDDGRLRCSAPRATLFPVWRRQYSGLLLDALVRAAVYVARFDDFDVRPRGSLGPRGLQAYFARISHETLEPPGRQPIHLSGWALRADAPLQLRVRSPVGHIFPSRVNFRPSPAAYEYLREQGREVPEARHARFHVWTSCGDACTLEAVSEGEVLARVPIDGRGVLIVEQDLLLHVWANEDLAGVPPITGPLRWWRFMALFRVHRLYRAIVPALAWLALFVYLTVSVRYLWERRLPPWWIVATALAGAVVARLLLVSLIDVTSYPAVRRSYLGPAYPLYLAWLVLVLGDGGRKAVEALRRRLAI